QGRGRLVQGGVVVTTKDGETRLDAPQVLLATGSVERVLPGMEIDGEVVCTSREALGRRELPASVVIIGGGAVGVEFAYAYRSFGAKVAVVEMADQLLPGMDADLGAELARQFSRQGIEVFAKTKVTRVSRSDSGGHVGVDGAGGERREPRPGSATRASRSRAHRRRADDGDVRVRGVGDRRPRWTAAARA